MIDIRFYWRQFFIFWRADPLGRRLSCSFLHWSAPFSYFGNQGGNKPALASQVCWYHPESYMIFSTKVEKNKQVGFDAHPPLTPCLQNSQEFNLILETRTRWKNKFMNDIRFYWGQFFFGALTALLGRRLLSYSFFHWSTPFHILRTREKIERNNPRCVNIIQNIYIIFSPNAKKENQDAILPCTASSA